MKSRIIWMCDLLDFSQSRKFRIKENSGKLIKDTGYLIEKWTSNEYQTVRIVQEKELTGTCRYNVL